MAAILFLVFIGLLVIGVPVAFSICSAAAVMFWGSVVARKTFSVVLLVSSVPWLTARPSGSVFRSTV